SAVGRLAKKTSGSAPAAMSGIPSTREASAQPVCTNGLKPNASRAVDGRRTRSGMRLREKRGDGQMKVVLFGATGMVGQGVLRECLLDPDVESVLAIVRKTSLPQHVKLREI